jgi:hypothetical protein
MPGDLLVVAILAFALFLPGFWWGSLRASGPDITRGWGVDDETPLGTLAQLSSIRRSAEHPNLGYPLMHPLMLGATFAPYLGWLWLTDRFQPQPTYPYGLTDPIGALHTLSLLSHFLSVLLATGIVIAVFDAARRLWDRRTAWLAAAFTATMFPLVFYSRTGNVDVPVLFFTALALNAFARVLADGVFTGRRALALGTSVGLALATKEPALASFLAIPIPVLVLHWLGIRKIGNRAAGPYLTAPLLALVSAGLAFGVGSGLLIDPARFFAHLEFVRGRVNELQSGVVSHVGTFEPTLQGNLALLRAIAGHVIDSLTLPTVLLAMAGALWVLFRERRLAAFLLPAVTYVAVLYMAAHATQLRYLMPVALTLAFFAARAAALITASRVAALRYAGGALLLAGLGLASLRWLDLTHAMIRDSHYQAGDWLAARTVAGTTIDYFGATQQLPHLLPGVTITRANHYIGAVYGPQLGPGVPGRIRQDWQTRRPDFVIIMPDHSSEPGSPYSASVPPEIYRDLLSGVLGYRLAATFETPRLLPWLRRPELDYPVVNPPIRIFVPAEAES